MPGDDSARLPFAVSISELLLFWPGFARLSATNRLVVVYIAAKLYPTNNN